MKPKTQFSYTYKVQEIFIGEGKKREKMGEIYVQFEHEKETGRIYCPKDYSKEKKNKLALMHFATSKGFPKVPGVKNIHTQNPPIQYKSGEKIIILDRYFDLKTAQRRQVKLEPIVEAASA